MNAFRYTPGISYALSNDAGGKRWYTRVKAWVILSIGDWAIVFIKGEPRSKS